MTAANIPDPQNSTAGQHREAWNTKRRRPWADSRRDFSDWSDSRLIAWLFPADPETEASKLRASCQDAGIRSGWARRKRIMWQVKMMAERYATGRWTQQELAEKYGVTQGCVSKRLKAWGLRIFPNQLRCSAHPANESRGRHWTPAQPLRSREGAAPEPWPWFEWPESTLVRIMDWYRCSRQKLQQQDSCAFEAVFSPAG